MTVCIPDRNETNHIDHLFIQYCVGNWGVEADPNDFSVKIKMKCENSSNLTQRRKRNKTYDLGKLQNDEVSKNTKNW